jgi:2'-5' RNA ligase
MGSNASVNGRLFLAAMPDQATAARIYHLARILNRAHKFSGKLIAPDRLHVSLFFVGALPQDQVWVVGREEIGEMRMPPFEVSFDRTASFRSSKASYPFVLIGGDGLNRLKSFRQELGAQLTQEIEESREHEFRATCYAAL